MAINRGRHFGIAGLAIVVGLLGLLAACGSEAREDAAPDVQGAALLEAEAILVAWCDNVRVVINPVVPLDELDPAQVRVSGEQTGSADPDDPPPAGTLRPGWAVDPPPTPTSTPASSTPLDSSPSAYGLVMSLDDPPSTEFCRTGQVPTVYLSLEAEVPDLSGVPVAEAIALLAERGIAVEAPTGYHPAAVVGSQSVAAGTIVPLGVEGSTPVTVQPAQVPANLVLLDVPDVQHLGVSAGCAILRSEGFECSVLTVSGEVAFEPDWEILAQWPRTPARAAEGATVKVVVSGPSVAVVPGVVDMPYGTACEILRDAHLICGISGDLGKREVSAQSPQPGASVEPGTVVTLQFRQVSWYETWSGRLLLLFIGGIVTALGGLLVRLAFGGRRRRR